MLVAVVSIAPKELGQSGICFRQNVMLSKVADPSMMTISAAYRLADAFSTSVISLGLTAMLAQADYIIVFLD